MKFLVRQWSPRLKLGLFLAIVCTICVGVYYHVTSYITYVNNRSDSFIYPDETEVFTDTCSDSMSASDINSYLDHVTPVIYFITPTYARREQVAELTRLSQTLLHVKNLVWIVAEDSARCTDVVSTTLLSHKKNIPYVHLLSPMPERYNHVRHKPKGVSSRNAAVDWIIYNDFQLSPGVIYFGDDDNTYDLSLFEEIRWTEKLSMFPVGFTAGGAFGSPVVENNKVIGFSGQWQAMRRFPVDMAGFAVNTYLLKKHKPRMPYLKGYEETLFLENMNITNDDIEPLANGCTEVLVWHTQTVKEDVPIFKSWTRQGLNLDALLVDVSRKGMLKESSSSEKEIKVCMKTERCK